MEAESGVSFCNYTTKNKQNVAQMSEKMPVFTFPAEKRPYG
jgi:hypothetical protein